MKLVVASLLLAHQMSEIAKNHSSEVRPDGSDDRSFPFSHSLGSFSSATSLMAPWGMSLGLPAYAAAGLVAHGRLRADRHHPLDVAIGALGGVLCASLISWLAAVAARRASPTPRRRQANPETPISGSRDG